MALCSTPGKAQHAPRNWGTSVTAKQMWPVPLKVRKNILLFHFSEGMPKIFIGSFNHIIDSTITFVLSRSAPEAGFCSSPWIPYNHHCFYLNRLKKSWSAAQKECIKDGGDLVSIHNVEEQSFVISQLGYGMSANDIISSRSFCLALTILVFFRGKVKGIVLPQLNLKLVSEISWQRSLFQ